MQQWILGVACAMLCTASLALEEAVTPTDSEKRVLIDRLLEQTGQSATSIGQQYANMFIQQLSMILRETNPTLDPRAFEVMQDEVRAVIQEKFVDNNQLAKMLYPIYNEHFSDEDLKQMIAFNETRLGKKLIRVMPAVTNASMRAGQEYGAVLGPIIQERLAARFAAEGFN